MLIKISAPVLLIIAVVQTASSFAVAQTIDGDVLRGKGKLAEGAGWYNLNTARANAINVSAMRNYNEEVRLNYRNRVMFWAEKREGKKLSTEEAQKRADVRLEELLNNPSNDDIRSGEAINVLVGVLSDSSINPQDWQDKAVKLPAGASIKDIVFHHYPKKMAPNEMKVLVSLSRLSKDIEWPIYLNNKSFDAEREAYINAVSKVKRTVLSNQFEPAEIKALNSSLDLLKEKIESSLEAKGGFRLQGKEFHSGLTTATKLFEASNIDWAKYILQETDQYDATTVEQLIAFMRQYRLLFAAADSPRSTKLYNDLFVSMKKQSSDLGVELGRMKTVDIDANPKSTQNDKHVVQPKQLPIDHFTVGSSWKSDDRPIVLTVTERNGKTFRAKFLDNVDEREVVGQVAASDTISWLAKDTKALKGNAGHDNVGTISSNGTRIDFTFGAGAKVKGKYTLRTVRPSDSENVTTSFFNGRDLAGWNGDRAKWIVVGETIVGTQSKNAIVNSCLYSDKEYGDFELHCKLKLVGENANSGIQIRSQVIDPKAFVLAGPQCDAGGKHWGNLYGERTGGMIREAPQSVVASAVKPNDFNDYFIRCVGKRITIKLNGQTTVDMDVPNISPRGFVGFQLHRPNGGEFQVLVRELVFKPL